MFIFNSIIELDITLKFKIFFLSILWNSCLFSQVPSCGYIYLSGIPSNSIIVYDPAQPLSVNNPSSTSISFPSSQSQAWALMPNISGGTLSPTFYSNTSANGAFTGYFHYWDGSSWAQTGMVYQGSNFVKGGLAGCGNFLYEVVTTVGSNTCAVYKYDGSPGSGTLVATMPYGLSVWDIVADCNCNFYLLDNGTPQNLRMYDSFGTALCSYSLTTPAILNAFLNGSNFNGGLAMVGNTVYLRTNAGNNPPPTSGTPSSGYFYIGELSGSSITFTSFAGMTPAFDFASCPVCNTNSITAVPAAASITCANPTAAITVTVYTALNPILYSWAGPGIVGTATNAIASATLAGNYTCTINAGGCPPFQPPTQTLVTVSVPVDTVVPIAAITPGGTICANTGQQIFSNPTGPNYSSVWAGPGIPGVANSATLNVVAPGIHSLSLTNTVNGCVGTATANVLALPNVGFILSSNSVCAQSLAGPSNNLSITPSGATSYTLTGAANYNISSPNGPVMQLTPVPPYSGSPVVASATLSGFNGSCFNSASVTFTILPNPTLSVLPVTATICAGEAQVFNASGATAYNWSPPGGLSTTAGSSVSASPGSSSVYLVYGIDNGCYSAAQSVSLTVKPLPFISVNSSGTGVCLNTTTIVLSAGGNATSYSWSPSSGISATNTQSVYAFPNSPTVYSVTGSLNGCTASAVTTVTVVPPPSLLASLSSPSMCAQALSGSPNTIVLTSSGASSYTLNVPNHIYNPNPSGPSSPLNLQPPYAPTGPATATLFGSNGVCTVSVTAVFTIVPNPTLSISSPTPVICAGQSFTYTNSGASSYSWSSANPGNTIYTTGNIAVANPSINSVFSVVGGSLGCNSAIQNFNITVNPLPVFSVTGNTLICPGTSGTLNAIGTATAFSWAPPFFLDNTSNALVVASPPTPQNYLVTGFLNSCSVTAAVTVSVLPSPVAQISAPKTVFCQNDEIRLFGSGGLAYAWKGPTNYSASGMNLSLIAISPAYSGIYTLTVSDASNCKASATQVITVNALPQGYLYSSSMKGCAPLCADLIFKSNPGTAPITLASWQVDQFVMSGASFKYCFKQSGEYRIYGQIGDQNNCANTVTATVHVFPKPKAGFEFIPEQPLENINEVQFTNTSNGASQFYWEFGSALNSSNKKDPQFLFENTGAYPVVLVVQNEWQCSDTIIKVINVEPDFAVYVPKAFTPNDDGINELFGPVLRGTKSFSFSVFDRWGTKVFESSESYKGWDGKFKGEPCQQDVYVWKLNITTEREVFSNKGKQAKVLTGEVLLYR